MAPSLPPSTFACLAFPLSAPVGLLPALGSSSWDVLSEPALAFLFPPLNASLCDFFRVCVSVGVGFPFSVIFFFLVRLLPVGG